MIAIHNFISSFLIIAGVAVGVASCGNSRGEDRTPDTAAADSIIASPEMPDVIKELTRSVENGDAEHFASLVSYPLARPYPLRNIRTSEEMINYYPVMVDDSLQRMIVGAGPSRWNEIGWRGWTLGNGNYIWVDEQIYDVPYLSVAELRDMKKLIERDTLSIDASLRNGWVPVECFRSKGKGRIYRLDHNPHHRSREAYRLAVWQKGDSLRRAPRHLYKGHRQSEGSAETITYFFAGKNGESAVYSPDPTDIDEPRRILMSGTGDAIEADTVESIYWLDLIGNR